MKAKTKLFIAYIKTPNPVKLEKYVQICNKNWTINYKDHVRTFFVNSWAALLLLNKNSGHLSICNSFKNGNSICRSPVQKLVSFLRSLIFRYCKLGNITILFLLSSWSMTIISFKTGHSHISRHWSPTKLLIIEDVNRQVKFQQLNRIRRFKFWIPQDMAATWFCQILSIFIEDKQTVSNFGNATCAITKLTSC